MCTEGLMNRTPPTAVRRELRREVGFGCPIAGCGIPYLTWHHFDPEWRIEEHHRPEGLIALCLTHAGHADGGAYERDYLKSLKQAGRPEAEEVRGRAGLDAPPCPRAGGRQLVLRDTGHPSGGI